MQQSEAHRPFQVQAFRGGELPLPIRTSSIRRPKQDLERPREFDVSNHERPLERGHLLTISHSQSGRTSKAGFKGFLNRTRSSKHVAPRVPMETSQDQTVISHRVVTMDALISNHTDAAVVPMEQSTTTAFPAIPTATFLHQEWPTHDKQLIPEYAAVWAPPQFCQAYPQAVKSATLLAPIIRHDALRRNPSKGYRHKRTDSKSEFAESSEPKNRRKWTSEYTSMRDWTRKIYILTTSGSLLQYADEGCSNRLPEKTMQLGKESVAFASDVIPGKHWVLQISQTPDVKGKVSTDAPRFKFGKLGPRKQIEVTPGSFLLILNSPEEMDSWLVAVRNEIQALDTSISQPELQCYDPITDDSQELPRPNGRYQVKENAKEVYSTLARVPRPKSSVAEVAEADRRTMRIDDPKMTDHERGHSSLGLQPMNLHTISRSLKSTDSAVCGRIRNSSTASNTSAGSTTLVPSAGSSAANLPLASSSTFPNAFTSLGNYTTSLVLDTRTTEQSPKQKFSSRQRKSEAWQAHPHQQTRYPQEPSVSRNRFSAAPSCWISDVHKPYASAMVPPPMLPPTPPASATDSGRSFPTTTAAGKEDFPNRRSLMVGELPVSSGQPCSCETKTPSRHSPKLHSAKGSLPNPPLSPYALTSFDLYGSSHTRPPSNPVKPDLAIPRRTSSLRHSRKFLSQSITKSVHSPPPSRSFLQVSPAPARCTQQPAQELKPTSGYSSQASKATRPHPFSVESDTAVPRRYSWIAHHPRNFSPLHPSYQTETPILAPTAASPALYVRNDKMQQQHDREWFTSAHSEQDQEPDHPTTTQPNPGSISVTQRENTRHPSCPPYGSIQDIQDNRSPLSYPPSSHATQRKIHNRRSTSQIPPLPFLGPPVCPPPSCPLPSIPSIGLSQSEGSLRDRDAGRTRRGVVVGGGEDGFRDGGLGSLSGMGRICGTGAADYEPSWGVRS